MSPLLFPPILSRKLDVFSRKSAWSPAFPPFLSIASCVLCHKEGKKKLTWRTWLSRAGAAGKETVKVSKAFPPSQESSHIHLSSPLRAQFNSFQRGLSGQINSIFCVCLNFVMSRRWDVCGGGRGDSQYRIWTQLQTCLFSLVFLLIGGSFLHISGYLDFPSWRCGIFLVPLTVASGLKSWGWFQVNLESFYTWKSKLSSTQRPW